MPERTAPLTFQSAHLTHAEVALNDLADRLESRWLNDEAFGRRKRALFISWCTRQADAYLGGEETWPSAVFNSLAAYRSRCVRVHDFLDFAGRVADRIAAGAGPSSLLRQIVEDQARCLARETSDSPTSAHHLICSAVAHAFGGVTPLRDVVCLLVEGMVEASPDHRRIVQDDARGAIAATLGKIDAMTDFEEATAEAPGGDGVEAGASRA